MESLRVVAGAWLISLTIARQMVFTATSASLLEHLALHTSKLHLQTLLHFLTFVDFASCTYIRDTQDTEMASYQDFTGVCGTGNCSLLVARDKLFP